MKLAILTAITLTALCATAVQADNSQPVSPLPEAGSPGTATPTPYPQVAPPATNREAGTEGNGPLLPKIEVPRPPKDQSLPGLEQNPAVESPKQP